MNSLVSIIIPTYNRAHLIVDTLNSIKEQTYSNWECIVVDDGSTDHTKQLLQDYIKQDERFKYLLRPNNRLKGANACRNYGLENSKGEFINWYDSDDVMSPQKLEIQIGLLKNNTEAPFCICQTKWVDKNTNAFIGLRAKEIFSDNRLEDYIVQKIFWSIMAPIWRRDFLETHNLKFDEALQQSQEYDFHIRALTINDNYITTDEALDTMFKHEENLSNNILLNDAKVLSNISVRRNIFQNLKNSLTSKTKLKVYESITLMYKDLLKLKRFKVAKKVQAELVNQLSYIDVRFSQKLIFKLRLQLIFYAYLFFGRGYNLLKPITE